NVGGVSPDGRVRLATADCNGASTTEPLVLVDGVAQPGIDAAKATEIAAHLRTGHASVGRAV
ncbi:MAG: hypothetical protein ABIZ34_03520, partial [Candidatus Limnocylindrales bacterium]